MHIGIDGSNISSGGGVTHLYEILNAVDFKKEGIKSIEVWSNAETLAKIKLKEGLILNSHPYLESGLLKRSYWQQKRLSDIAHERYDMLYIPGGSYLGSFSPYVTMNRNLQPFDDVTRNRYNLSSQKIRLALLKKIQAKTYRKAAGVIFLSEEAKKLTLNKIGGELTNVKTVPHGIAQKFFNAPKKQQAMDDYTFNDPFRLLYASRINVYKHQWNVIEAVHTLRSEGYPIVLKLVGNIENNQSRKLFNKALNKFDSENNFVQYHGRTTQEQLLEFYHNADAFVFASSCETFGQILLEAMASALPIACSKRSAMPEILKNNGVYFNPEEPSSIRSALQKLLDSKELRQQLSRSAHEEATSYSWEKCAQNTFGFIREVYQSTK
jgi:glycosyltransferase involved in cell wall biosynthesis